VDTGTHTADALNTITGANENALAPETSVPEKSRTQQTGWVGVVSKNKADCGFPLVSPHSGDGQLQGGNAICSREWLTAPPLVLLPRQEVTELLKLVTNGQNSSHQPSTLV
jgi:hypothetical protein